MVRFVSKVTWRLLCVLMVRLFVFSIVWVLIAVLTWIVAMVWLLARDTVWLLALETLRLVEAEGWLPTSESAGGVSVAAGGTGSVAAVRFVAESGPAELATV